jgi:hypothetical protein
MDKKMLINVVLTFAYFLAGGIAAIATDNVTLAVLLPVVAGAVRATIGLYAKKRGAALPPDA